MCVCVCVFDFINHVRIPKMVREKKKQTTTKTAKKKRITKMMLKTLYSENGHYQYHPYQW